MPDKITPGQASTVLGIPSSSLRRYVALFSEFLSPGARRLRGRQFTEQDLATLARVRDLASSGLKLELIHEQIRAIIEQNEPIQPEPEQPPEQTSALALPGLLKQIEGMAASFSESLAQLQAEQDSKINELQRQVDELKAEQAKPWYRRIFPKKSP